VSIYLDHNATTPVRPEVADAMAAALRALPGNPSSTHASGRAARAAVEDARADVARLVGAHAEEIVFTSGGTEANDLAIRGLLRSVIPVPRSVSLAPRSGSVEKGGGVRGRLHVVTSRLEHPSVLAALAAEDADVTYVAVDPDGRVTPDALRAALRPDTVLVTLALANHELGNVYDVAALARVAHDAGALFHADAVQAAGKLEIAVDALGVDALTLSAHKFHGPKGVGAAYIRRGVSFTPLTAGGHQERERRAGTENVSGIVGFGVAARLAAADLANAAARVGVLRDRLEARLLAIPGARRNGDGAQRLPGTLNVGFAGAPGQFVAAALDLDGISVSTGAACTSGSLAPSEVLRALGLSAEEAGCAIRIGIGAGNTEEEIERVGAAVEDVVRRVRGATTTPAKKATTTGQRERVVVAMSGGVDSSAAAALLVERGYEVIGATLRLYDASGTAASIGGRCCGPRDIEDARATAAHLGIAHHVIDESAAFQASVIDDFVAGYRAGQTPNPCVRCNEKLKFGPLLAFADAVGATALATGHYARLAAADGGGVVLGRARDRGKDQSYFLFGVRPELLSRVWFPLGDMSKDDVRALARRAGLPNADKPDSQQICFIPDGDHRQFVEAHGGAGRAGAIVDDTTGADIGRHGGTHAFTIGQRRGIPGGAGAPRFVLRIDAATGEVRVGPRDRLGRDRLRVGDVRWLDPRPAGGAVRCAVQIRHHAVAAPAWIEPEPDGAALVRLDEPAFGVAPGQAAVFYDSDDRVIGGGWIQ
jgi:tRNA (5-methylaminomethyl-2-thiouridylate)-methyltransferase